jgi:hypothetical protein
VTAFLGEKGSGVLHVGTAASNPIVPPTPDPSTYNFGGNPFPLIKTRFISFSITGGGSDETAIRIKLTSLHHVVPPYPTGPSTPFTAFEGQSVWVGPPTTYAESSSQPGQTFKQCYAKCTPHYRNWNTEGLLHVTGSGIVPSSIYDVENVSAACQGVEGSGPCLSGGANVSSPLQVKTTRWGDVAESFNPPATTGQPDLADVSAMVSKFRALLGAPIKARALITGQDAWGVISAPTIQNDFNFSHIASCVDAFRGTGYPFKMGKCATVNSGTGACTANSDCIAPNVGPCNLYCPP